MEEIDRNKIKLEADYLKQFIDKMIEEAKSRGENSIEIDLDELRKRAHTS